MHFDAIVIGAGMSGLAAGIRLALFEKKVCIVERHYAYGGLNSYYTLNGRRFDVGLHALTNYAAPGVQSGPLPKVLRQLRIRREELDLRPQSYSEIRFPGRRLRFSNDLELFLSEVRREFPCEADAFVRFLDRVRAMEYGSPAGANDSARAVLAETFRDPLLIEMLLCPVMYYGSATERDMAFGDFVIIFRSLYCEGFARPRDGVLGIIKPLVRKFRSCGGKLRMQCGVEHIECRDHRALGVLLQSGERLTCDALISSAGLIETMRLCGESWNGRDAADVRSAEAANPLSDAGPILSTGSSGRVSFVESFLLLDRPPAELGMPVTITFFNEAPRFEYATPEDFVDLRSGVVCCPNNYQDHDHLTEGIFRVTWLANHAFWDSLPRDRYDALKREYLERVLERAAGFIPNVRDHVVFTDMFTPRTIESFTGHIGGAVYGHPVKSRDGRTPIENLFLCGTDQGFVGIVGVLMSGITMANTHVLSKPA